MNKYSVTSCIIVFLLGLIIGKNLTKSKLKKIELSYENQIIQLKIESNFLKNKITSLNFMNNSSQNTHVITSHKIIHYPDGTKKFEKTKSKKIIKEEKNSISNDEVIKIVESKNLDKNYIIEKNNHKEEILKADNNINLYVGVFFPKSSNLNFDDYNFIAGFLYKKSSFNYGGFLSLDNKNPSIFGIASTLGISF